MDRPRIPEAITSALSVAALLGVGTFFQGYVLRQRRPPPFPPPEPVKVWNDFQWQSGVLHEFANGGWVMDRHGIVFPATGEAPAGAATPVAENAMQLPISPSQQQYRYYCEGLQRYYPDVMRCPERWQLVSTVAP